MKITNGDLYVDYKKTKKRLDPIMGFHNLVTGDVKSDGSEMVVLEHGKHFHVISLETFEVVKKVSLPRTFMATDVYCTYSDDGKTLTVTKSPKARPAKGTTVRIGSRKLSDTRISHDTLVNAGTISWQ